MTYYDIGLNVTSGFIGMEVRPARITVKRIQQVVASYFDIAEIEMVSARRSREVARPRQVAMYLAKQLTPKSLPDIGRRFGGRDHTTVIHAIRTIEKLTAIDGELAVDVEALRARLTPPEAIAA